MMHGAKQIFRIVVAVLLCAGFTSVQAQIQGPNKVGNNTTYTYSYNDGFVVSGAYWTVTKGTIQTSWSVGTTYYVVINWTATGTGALKIFASDGLTASLNVTVATCSAVSTPTVTGASRCSAGTLTLNATPGSGGTGIRWYDNTTNSVILASTNSFVTPSLSSTTIYNATTFNTTSGCESSKVAVTATIATAPTAAATAQTICSGAATSIAITNPNNIAGTTYSWTVVQSGTSGAASGSGATIAQTLTATGSTNGTATYTITPTANGCAGTPITVVATVKPKPTVSAAATQSIFSGNATSVAITNPNAIAGTTFSWTVTQTNVSGATSDTGSTIAQTLTATTIGTAVYTIIPAANGCNGTTTTSTITVTPKPIVTSAAGNTITLGKVTLDAGAGYDTYDWRNSSNTQVSTTRTLSTSVKGTYTVKVTKGAVTGSTTSAPFVLSGQLDAVNMNYIVSSTLLAGNITTQAQVLDQPVDSVNQTIQYFDGLGRPIQTVVTQGSPLKQDVVQANVYDAFGREPIKYLPYVSTQTNGQYKTNAVSSIQAFYNNTTDKIEDDANPYAVTVFEASPLNRVIKQGAPGAAWQPNASLTDFSDRVIKQNYLFNVVNEVILFTYVEATPSVNHYVTSGTAPNPTYYPANTLHATKTYDEHNNEVIEYKDNEGKVVLKKVQYQAGLYACTYYIYDDFGKLRVVLPPEASKRLATEYFPTTITQTQKETFLAQWAFRYKYDYRLRMIEKQVPGAAPVYMVYDLRDRLVMTQDGNQRANKEWTTTKYDTLNRPVMTCIYTHGTAIDQPTMSGLISTIKFSESYNGLVATHGYTLNVFPTTNLKVLSVSYYDDYKFRKMISDTANYVYSQQGIGPAIVSNETQGLPTGSRVNILNSTNYLWSISYYDKKNRVAQTITQNHVNGHDIVTNQLDFAGRVKKTKTTHVKDATTKTIARTFVYDHGSRVKEVYHKFDDQPELLLLRNEYNEIGQVVTKQTHSRDNGTTFAQNTDYRFNIRGWLDKINDPTAPEASDLFSMDLNYNTPTPNGGTALYNGNISETIWTSAGNEKQSYGYSYDALNRLTEAKFYNLARPLLNGRYTERVMGPSNTSGYDLNGNIKYLQRYGKKDATTFGLMDDLAYTYTGNQLTRVDDAIAKNAVEEGFKENAQAATEYGVYDANGSMTKDDNKGITAITYNYLNLPVQVNKGATDYIIYTYDATGRKLRQQVFGTTPKTTDYVGEFIYENNAIAFVSHEEGRIVADNSVGAPRPWEYQYYLKDHLGNVRITFSEKKTTSAYKATMETATQTNEQSTFKGYKNPSPLSIFNHTNGGTYAQVLNGGSNNQVGLAKSLAVNSGDVIDMEVYAKYESTTGSGNNLSTLFTALAGTFALNPSGGTGIDGQQAYNSFNSLFGAGPIITSDKWESNVAPKAYLNYILFDQNFVLVDFGFDQIGTNGEQVGVTPVTAADYLNLHVTVKQKGYLYIYVSNENPVNQNVYFDDLKIVHNTGVEQISNYYGFGLLQGSNSFEKPNLVNQPLGYNGKELQDELSIGWLDYQARQYDPSIARWMAIDPLSEVSRRWSPYTYCYNNPLLFVDPDGMLGEYYDREGKHLGKDNIVDNKVYVAECVDKDEKGVVISATGAVDLGVTHDDFATGANVIKHESSGNKTESLWIAHTANNAKDNNDIDYRKQNTTLKDQLTDSEYSTTPSTARTALSTEDRSSSANNARAAVIDVLTGGKDPTGGAVLWDGNDFLRDGKSHNKFKEYNKVSISADNLQTYAMGVKRPGKSIDGTFWVPIITKTSYEGSGNSRRDFNLTSSGAKGYSIFWRISKK